MSKTIEIGDYVEVLDDTLSGVVTEVRGDQVTFETEEGFPMTFSKNQLIIDEGLMLNQLALAKAVQEKKLGARKTHRIRSKKREKERPLEVDLHIEELTSSTRNMSDYEMLNLQLHTARGQLEFAIRNHIQRIVFIHGIGKGVLRAELETLLRRYEQVDFYDADFQKYGRGATEVYIYQNKID